MEVDTVVPVEPTVVVTEKVAAEDGMNESEVNETPTKEEMSPVGKGKGKGKGRGRKSLQVTPASETTDSTDPASALAEQQGEDSESKKRKTPVKRERAAIEPSRVQSSRQSKIACLDTMHTAIRDEFAEEEKLKRAKIKAKEKKKASKSKGHAKKPSAGYYAMYANGDESIESIMQKFEVMEKIRAETGAGEESELNEKQLEQLFKMTTFEPLSHILKDSGVEVDDDDWLVEMESDSSSGWTCSSSSSSAARTGPREKKPRKERERKIKAPKEPKPKKERGVREKILQTQYCDDVGRMVVLKRRVKYVDPNLPTLIKLPNCPMPRTWAMKIAPWKPRVLEPHSQCNFISTRNVLDYDLSTLGGDFEGILMDPPWAIPGREVQHEAAITVADLAKLKIDDMLMPFGLLFIWIEKEVVPELLKLTKQWKFEYVEHFAAVNRDLNNRLNSDQPLPGCLFQRTKSTVLIFRKKISDPDPLELRHQRNPDVTFEFMRKYNRGITSDRCEFLYHVIETMLPNAAYRPEQKRGKLLHLWSPGFGASRPGWTSICDERSVSGPVYSDLS